MSKRKIIKIDEKKCNGCGLCIPNCPEGALQVIDGKARLISDLFCDGLGACIGHCPLGAITIEERDAQEYAEKKVMVNIAKQGKNVIKAHLEHLRGHKQQRYLSEAISYLKENGLEIPLDERVLHAESAANPGCPGSRMADFRNKKAMPSGRPGETQKRESQLQQWPVQIALVPPNAPYFDNADLLIAADCVPFAYASFHEDLLRGKILLVGCPKLDDTVLYKEKITKILNENSIKSISYAHMEVPCCFGLVRIIKEALSDSGKKVPFKEVLISIKGERLK